MDNVQLLTIEKKSFPFETKDITSDGQFTGYAAIFGNVDQGGDMIMHGAFRKTLQDNKRKAPVLHDHMIAVGAADLEETSVGLRAIGTFNLDKIAAREAYSDLKFYRSNGISMGMSIGYLPVGTPSRDADGVRILRELKLFEITLTLQPMNERATVTSVKSRAHEREVLRLLSELRTALQWESPLAKR